MLTLGCFYHDGSPSKLPDQHTMAEGILSVIIILIFLFLLDSGNLVPGQFIVKLHRVFSSCYIILYLYSNSYFNLPLAKTTAPSLVHSTPPHSKGIRLCLFHRVQDYPGCLGGFVGLYSYHLWPTEQVAPHEFVHGYVFGKQSEPNLSSSWVKV